MDNLLGYDYATRPSIAVLGDVEFPKQLGPNLLALGYSELPHFGILVNPPLLTLIFVSEDAAQKAFTHFKSWIDASDDGDAVGLGFVETEDGGYRVCIYQENSRQFERCIPEHLREEVEPLFVTATFVKSFPHRSESYKWFRQAASRSPIVVALGTADGGPIQTMAFRKRELRFYVEQEIPQDAYELAAIGLRKDSGQGLPTRHREARAHNIQPIG